MSVHHEVRKRRMWFRTPAMSPFVGMPKVYRTKGEQEKPDDAERDQRVSLAQVVQTSERARGAYPMCSEVYPLRV